jgi:sirohydrochlorin cobaltochelatase
MPTTLEDVLALEVLENRLRAILPEQYQDSYEDVLPVSMGSAGLKYDVDGKVAWDQMWATFCDLAMAGGPPHRGTLLEPASVEEISAQPDPYERVSREICRGIRMVTGLNAQPSCRAGWIEVACNSAGMAGWLVRAIVMENILARHDGHNLYLPAGPHFRLEREIKNVITATAKTCHYWTGHIPAEQQRSIEQLLTTDEDSRLLGPALLSDLSGGISPYPVFLSAMSERIRNETRLQCFANRYFGWVGVECPSVRAAIWIMRAMVAGNVLARREGVVLFVPVNPSKDSTGERAVRTLLSAHHLASVKKLL